jgi:hypothetical protein
VQPNLKTGQNGPKPPETGQFSRSSPGSRPDTGHQLDTSPDFFARFCGFCRKMPKNRRNRSPNLERIFSKKSRIGGNPPVLPKFF